MSFLAFYGAVKAKAAANAANDASATAASVKVDLNSRPTLAVRAGTPEGNLSAIPGSRCYDTTNDVDYVKASGTGNTGWE